MSIWDPILGFIRRSSPEHATAFVGITREEIAEWEARCAVSLPTIYRGFLAAMGADCDDFHPFGVSQVCDFHALIVRLPATNYPGDRYFKVSCEGSPEAVTFYDTFIDLRRSDGDDAPLVRFEDDEWFAQEDVIEVGFTLGEELMRSAFDRFQLGRRPASNKVSIFCESASEIAPTMRRLHAHMRERGLADELPGSPRVACLHSEPCSVLLESHESLKILRVAIGAQAVRVASAFVEELLDQFPHAMTLD